MKLGLPPGNVFEYSALQVLQFEKRYKSEMIKKRNEVYYKVIKLEVL